MKIKSYNLLFRIFSYLSDKTNGAPLFVKYKLLLGSLIIGMTATTGCKALKGESSEYEFRPAAIRITDYVPIGNGTDSVMLKGNIIDDRDEPLIGLIVGNKNLPISNRSLTDIDGNFEIKAAINDIIVFSYVGYDTEEIPVKDLRKNNSQLVINPSNTKLSCYIVIIGKTSY
ncbi:MAG: carboxypeptidase-like regulatory domain-containing protein [Dysgonomonas sp.]|nr:carboxypeptidase-like regulatory domain-containing protein [Dysgonomonas sp.]